MDSFLPFQLEDCATWPWWLFIAWPAVILGALEILNQLLLNGFLPSKFGEIPKSGHHLDEFNAKDILFICINKLSVAFFTYHMLRFCVLSDRILWRPSELTPFNTVAALVLLYVVYDFFYYWLHRILHHRSIYSFVHKHHHRQMAPSRGNLDAINVHPFELISGEYNHLFTLFLITRYITSVHAMTILTFVLLSGLLASLNHTRADVKFFRLYLVAYHDIHHYQPNTNYSQYFPIWDVVFGSFKDTNTDASSKQNLAAAKAGKSS
jgi:sterol desaturase/sphingolipid hydroxylase (fatty acid hydroxylase superfamily)